MLKSEVEAEELENAAKKGMKDKNFELAFKCFEKAKQIYNELNYRGKILFIEKQLANLRRVIDYEKGEGTLKTQNAEVQVSKPEYITKESELFSKKSQEIKKDAVMDQNELSMAEIRRVKLREKVESGENVATREAVRDIKIQERESIRNNELKNIEDQFKIQAEKTRTKEELKDKADWALERARLSLKHKDFKEAKGYYKETIDIFKELGWFDQVGLLYDEIKNVDNLEMKHLRDKNQANRAHEIADAEFQKRVDDVMSEKEQEKQKELDRLKGLPPDLRRTMEKANLMMEKAQKEEKVNIKRALGRYQLILELYNSIPSSNLDLTSTISQIENKITELEGKI